MKIKSLILSLLLTLTSTNNLWSAAVDYSQDSTYQSLRKIMTRTFNESDSAGFAVAVKDLEDYLLKKDDLHGYYTQRCNEIIFLMNRQRVFEAYKLAQKLSHELHEKNLQDEMYMAINMMGHIYRFCGNKDKARECFWEVIHRMSEAGYRESMPPIFMNLVNVELSENPDEAMRLLDTAVKIAREKTPERVFDIEARRTLAYYTLGDTAKFMAGYKAYREGVAEGLTSVHGRSIEIYHLALLGKTDEAVRMADKELASDDGEMVAEIFKKAGRWQEAFGALEHSIAFKDSLTSVILSNNIQGIEDELQAYENERQQAKTRLFTISAIALLLLVLAGLLTYIVISRRKHVKELRTAYQHALESDNMKSAFIQNVSHEVRTPLNIISGFAQVIANPDMDTNAEDRLHMATMMQKNANRITQLIDEMLELSHNESMGAAIRDEKVVVNDMLNELLKEAAVFIEHGVTSRLSSSLPADFTIMTNTNMLKRIIISLLSNAAKNTDRGSITVIASADSHQLTIGVEDTGCGIPITESERIFERFVKLDNFKAGIGLGLTLCRSAAKRLGGNVTLDTTYTRGARFVVTIPLQA